MTLVNIIHPYTYKQLGDTLNIGPVDQFGERDKRVSDFVKSALDSARVVRHDCRQGFMDFLIEGALRDDPNLAVLYDSRVDVVVTTSFGAPIPDVRPPNCPVDEWETAIKRYTSRSDYFATLGSPDVMFFIGGVLENCVANDMGYVRSHYSGRMLYVPDLCVSFDEGLLAQVKLKLAALDILPVSVDDAVGLF